MITRLFFCRFLFGCGTGRLPRAPRWRGRVYRRAMAGLLVCGVLALGLGAQTGGDVPAAVPTDVPGPAAAPDAVAYVPGELIDFVAVPAGSFRMGNASTGDQNERPVHQVTLDAFRISRTEVTRKQYKAAGFSLPLKSMAADDLPLTNISWLDALKFCNALSARDGLEPVYTIKGKVITADPGQSGYRLPTEAEWEYAARGAGSEEFNYAGSDRANEVSWYDENSGRTVQPVAKKLANGLGLYDLSGNVWEWCWDYFQAYSAKPQANPLGPATGKFRVVRGGSVLFNDSSSRSGFRRANDPSSGASDIGFRIVKRS